MQRSNARLRADAERIWRAGLEAVDSRGLVRGAVRVEGSTLRIEDEEIDLATIGRIEVVGAGKAGAGMAAALEDVLGPKLRAEHQLSGWVNVPDDCVQPLGCIHLHGARPAGLNEPTDAGVAGTEEILRRVASLGPSDLCICLISGGGSALLPAPTQGVTLADKLAVTRHLSAAGANIAELNTVRKQLSRVKGGGLARACRAGRLIALIISDVLGDPLDVIASGPTVDDPSTPAEALAVLEKFDARKGGVAPAVLQMLENASTARGEPFDARVTNLVIGSNATAVDAAGLEAERLGYRHAMIAATSLEGCAEDIGRHLASMAMKMRDQAGPNCLISGGEPVVRLVDAALRGRGGRNQQLVLAACTELIDDGAAGLVLLSGGTDGEDGPTDAAGAVLDGEVVAAAVARGLNPREYLARNDAYHFFEPLGALLITGPTGTNVCDLRVIVVDRE